VASGWVLKTLQKISQQTFLHLEKYFSKKNVLFPWLTDKITQRNVQKGEERIILQLIFNPIDLKGKAFFPSQLFNNDVKTTENITVGYLYRYYYYQLRPSSYNTQIFEHIRIKSRTYWNCIIYCFIYHEFLFLYLLKNKDSQAKNCINYIISTNFKFTSAFSFAFLFMINVLLPPFTSGVKSIYITTYVTLILVNFDSSLILIYIYRDKVNSEQVLNLELNHLPLRVTFFYCLFIFHYYLFNVWSIFTLLILILKDPYITYTYYTYYMSNAAYIKFKILYGDLAIVTTTITITINICTFSFDFHSIHSINYSVRYPFLLLLKHRSHISYRVRLTNEVILIFFHTFNETDCNTRGLLNALRICCQCTLNEPQQLVPLLPLRQRPLQQLRPHRRLLLHLYTPLTGPSRMKIILLEANNYEEHFLFFKFLSLFYFWNILHETVNSKCVVLSCFKTKTHSSSLKMKHFGFYPNTILGERLITFYLLKQESRYLGLHLVCEQKPFVTSNLFNEPQAKRLRFKLVNSMIKPNKPMLRHKITIIAIKLSNDIEKNPGPNSSTNLKIVTQNCRGLNKIDKFRLVLDKAAEMIKLNTNTIIMLQETMITNTNYIDLAWRGQYIFTPGTGNSQGCITLLDKNIKIAQQNNLGHRGHTIEIELPEHTKITLFNIYAPCGYNQEKREFYNNVFNRIEQLQNINTIIAGDFNLTMSDIDRHNRQTSAGERSIASSVQTRLVEYGIKDCWEGYCEMTWKKGISMSRLDRVYSRVAGYRQIDIKTDWTFCDSDHAAVITIFSNNSTNEVGMRPCRLNPQVVLDNETLQELRSYLNDQLQTIDTSSNPHFILEFVKMTIRTKALQLGKRQESNEADQLKFINDDIIAHQRLLLTATDSEAHGEINQIIQTRMNEKNNILEQQGKRLAWKSKTKWYNEGEKSNKYFLNLLKSGPNINEMSRIKVGSDIVTEPKHINIEVNNFYQRLYNNNNNNNNIVTYTGNEDFFKHMFTVDPTLAYAVNNPITLTELWETLKPLKDTSPGPDGISHIYLKKLWDIVGPIILQAWNYSLQVKKMPPSHYKSYLKLIPKTGKDLSLLKNWRPITLSNCDHKLITRIYNKRLLNVLKDQITNLQTAYIKGRNITDNIRMINSAIQLASFEPQISGSIVALDAQKAFDTVRHDYLKIVLEKTGLGDFAPIFDLLYKGINNDLLINGKIKGNHMINNGVKQGDALSCTLFILAIEPLIRNLQSNPLIKPIKSLTLQYSWPKVYAYADDITCVITNDSESKQNIFSEYEKLTKVSGLKLNADKTEIYDFGGLQGQTVVNYCDSSYTIDAVGEIKINGILLCQDQFKMKRLNTSLLIDKMDRHFTQWSKRNLSLLGKIQIFKTFGMSQYLYHLNVFEPTTNLWKIINDKIRKFLWNKKYEGNTAPLRIKNSILETPIACGGFGMVNIKQVAAAMRLRRHFLLTESDLHPMHQFIKELTHENDYLDDKLELQIDEITQLNLTLLKNKRLCDYIAPDWQVETDLNLQASLTNVKLTNIIRPRKLTSREANEFTRRGIRTLIDALQAHPSQARKLISIAHKNLTKIITILFRDQPTHLPRLGTNIKIRDKSGAWLTATQMTSKKIREIFFLNDAIALPKITVMSNELIIPYYYKISKLLNVPNKSKMLRLLHGDVYTADRMVRFGMAETDMCRRCFSQETIMHLLTECPYSLEVYSLLGIEDYNCNEILGAKLGRAALEIRCDIVTYLLFRLHILPTDVLVHTTLEKYSKNLTKNVKITQIAEKMLQRHKH
jgi:hypothetical protein